MSTEADAIEVADLRDVPHFLEPLALAIWDAFWQASGHSSAWLLERARASLDAAPIPFCFVAYRGTAWCGTASVIASDLDERPGLTPWLAAVLVDPRHRQCGIGTLLVEAATEHAFHIGVETLHLCAAPGKQAFYERLGWTVLERDVPRPGQHVMVRDAGSRRPWLRTTRPAGE